MATQTASQIEAQHRARLADIKHRHYMAKREHQLERLEVRIELLKHRAQQLSDATKANLANKYMAFRREVAGVKAAGGATTKAQREAANAAFKELRAAFQAAYEEAGLAQAKAAKKAAKAGR